MQVLNPRGAPPHIFRTRPTGSEFNRHGGQHLKNAVGLWHEIPSVLGWRASCIVGLVAGSKHRRLKGLRQIRHSFFILHVYLYRSISPVKACVALRHWQRRLNVPLFFDSSHRADMSFLLFFFLALTATVRSQDSCKCYEGDSCWPAESDWAALNETVGGALQVALPPGRFCYQSFEGQSTYNSQQCNTAITNWADADWMYYYPNSYLSFRLYNNIINQRGVHILTLFDAASRTRRL